MAAKIFAFLIPLSVSFVVAAIVFFFLLLAMNGYSESDAQWGLLSFVVLAVVILIAMAVGSLLMRAILSRRGFKDLSSVLISATVFSLIGLVLLLISAVLAVVVAEVVRVNL